MPDKKTMKGVKAASCQDQTCALIDMTCLNLFGVSLNNPFWPAAYFKRSRILSWRGCEGVELFSSLGPAWAPPQVIIIIFFIIFFPSDKNIKNYILNRKERKTLPLDQDRHFKHSNSTPIPSLVEHTWKFTFPNHSYILQSKCRFYYWTD